MSELSRDEQLVRASKARAAITGFLSQHEDGPATQDVIFPAVEALGLTPTELGSLMYRMAADGLIVKHEVDHAHYRVGYTSLSGLVTPAESKRKYTKKPQAATEGEPIDVRVNEREGIITIRYAGMVLSFSKE